MTYYIPAWSEDYRKPKNRETLSTVASGTMKWLDTTEVAGILSTPYKNVS